MTAENNYFVGGYEHAEVLKFAQGPNSDGGYTLYAALKNTPKAVFYSTASISGEYVSSRTWRYAGGGEYDYGKVYDLVASSESVFIATDQGVMASPHTVPLDWRNIMPIICRNCGVPIALATDDKFLFVLTDPPDYKLYMIRLTDFEVVDSTPFLYGGGEFRFVAIAAERTPVTPGGNSALFFIKGCVKAGGCTPPGNAPLNLGEGRLLKLEYSESEGKFVRINFGYEEKWLVAYDVTPMETMGKFQVTHLAKVFSSGDGVTYVTTNKAQNQVQDGSGSGIYRSYDHGKNWAHVQTEGHDRFAEHVAAAFSSRYHIVGDLLFDVGEGTKGAQLLIHEGNLTIEETSCVREDPTASAYLLDKLTPQRIFAFFRSCGIVVGQELPVKSWDSMAMKLAQMPVMGIDLHPNKDLGAIVHTNGVELTRNASAAFDEDIKSQIVFAPLQFLFANYRVAERNRRTYSVAFDQTRKASTLYVGSHNVLQVDPSIDSGNNVVMGEEWLGEEVVVEKVVDEHSVIRNLLFTDRLIAGFSSLDDNIGGRVVVYEPTQEDLSPSVAPKPAAVGLRGEPISALAGSANIDRGRPPVIFAAFGGYRVSLEDDEVSGPHGIYRSLDNGVSWHEIVDAKLSEKFAVALAYDDENDILYIGANSAQVAAPGRDSPYNNGFLGTTRVTGSVLRIEGASQETLPAVSDTDALGLPNTEPITALTVASFDKSYRVFAASGKTVYESNSYGDNWSPLYRGVHTEEIRSMIFDDLAIAGNNGLNIIRGNPNLIVSRITPSYANRRLEELRLRFSREILTDEENLRHIKIHSAEREIPMELAKRNSRVYSLKPGKGGSFPARGKITLSLRGSLKATRNQHDIGSPFLDVNYDGLTDEAGEQFFTHEIEIDGDGSAEEPPTTSPTPSGEQAPIEESPTATPAPGENTPGEVSEPGSGDTAGDVNAPGGGTVTQPGNGTRPKKKRKKKTKKKK